MARVELVGVTKVIRDAEIRGLTDAEQDDTIKRVAEALETDLRRFVLDARPDRNRPLIFDVKGPFSDPIQGVIHSHTLAGWFDLDALPRESDAYRVHVLEAPGATEGNTQPGGQP